MKIIKIDMQKGEIEFETKPIKRSIIKKDGKVKTYFALPLPSLFFKNIENKNLRVKITLKEK